MQKQITEINTVIKSLTYFNSSTSQANEIWSWHYIYIYIYIYIII
jgi:hypothetical protein